MYQPSQFVEQDPDVLLSLMRSAPLATLVRGGDELAADVMPLEVDRVGDGWRFIGHVARANPLWTAADGQPVLVLFQGPQAYVSPGWYASKSEHGKVVPTWNYMMVQAHGRLRAIEDPAWLRAMLTRLTARHETGRERPWHLTDAPEGFIDSLLNVIVGIEIEVTRLEGKFKMSQNRSAEDRAGVIEGLASDARFGLQAGADGVARAMMEIEQRRAAATERGGAK
jgi:transcriptional regulator